MDGSAKKRIQSHTKAVYTLVVEPSGGFISGSRDNKVIFHGPDLKKTRSLSFESGVHAVTLQGTRLVVGTAHAEIYEASTGTSVETKILVKAHHDGSLCGLAVDPLHCSYFATCGEDNKIFIWEAISHRPLVVLSLSDREGKRRKRGGPSAILSSEPSFRCGRSIAYSPDSTTLVVGTNAGEIVVFHLSDMTRLLVHDLSGFSAVVNAEENWIKALRFSPNGKTLAVGTRGGAVVLCDVNNGFSPTSTLGAHNASITQLDWSLNSDFIRCNDSAYELLFHSVNHQDLRASKHEPNSLKLKDVLWATQSCILGWGVQGTFDPLQDGTDINTTDQSPDKKLLVTGDDYGYVKLWRYPVTTERHSHRVMGGHSAHVMCTRFLSDQSYVLSFGGNDKCIFQWKVRNPDR